MSLSINERGNLRKPVKNVFVKNPNMKKLNEVNNFVNTGYTCRTVYNEGEVVGPSLERKNKLDCPINRKGVSQSSNLARYQ